MKPVQRNMKPVQRNMKPVQRNMKPVQRNMKPVQRDMKPVQCTDANQQKIKFKKPLYDTTNMTGVIRYYQGTKSYIH